MKNNIKYSLLLLLGQLILLQSCKKNDNMDAENPVAIIPQEQITTVVLSGFDMNDSTALMPTFTVKWEDLDGVGGVAPSIDTLMLDTRTQYATRVLLLDKTKSPWDTISNEVEELKNIHQFFYTPNAALDGKIKIMITDSDNNTPALPVGLSFSINTISTLNYAIPLIGGLKMILSHYDGIPKTTAPSPESDIDITFPVKLK